MEFIDLKEQYRRIEASVNERIQSVLKHGRFIMGPEVAELEEKLADYVGVRHAIAVSSGTDALLIAMMALEIGPGDEVITTPFTFIATGEMISLIGAKLVFADIDPKTYNLNPEAVEAAITPRTKAIMPVSLYGQCADFDRINSIADSYGLPVIEDGAQSFGATYMGRRSCGLTTVGCTSFFPSKPLGCYGDAGACFTNDELLAKRMREIRIHGQDRRYHHPVIGINGRCDTLQAAILLAKVEVFPEEVAARQAIGKRYSEEIAARCPGTIVPFIESHNTSVFAQYTVQVADRDEVAMRLDNERIPTAVHYPVPLHMQPVFTELAGGPGSFPAAESAAARVLSLPMHPYLDSDTQDEIVTKLEAALAL